jgi:polyisoprenoid-binding protein YceI
VGLSGEITIPADLAEQYTVTSGKATYEVPEMLSGLSSVGVGESTGVTGTIQPGGAFEFTLDLLSFTSDQSRRDNRVVGWFQEFPKGTFSGTEFDMPPSATVGESVTFPVEGVLTINDITLPATWQVEARVESDGTLSIQGETDIVLSDFNIPVVTGGFVTMEDSAHLEILVSAAP